MLVSGVNVNWPLLGIPAIWEKMMGLISRNLRFYESLPERFVCSKPDCRQNRPNFHGPTCPRDLERKTLGGRKKITYI